MIEKITARLLAIKSRTTDELRKKLKLKGFHPDEIEIAIKKFTHLGYLNDAEIVTRRFEMLIKKGYGPRLVAIKLQQQGLKMPSYPIALQKKVAQDLLKTSAFRKKDPQKQGAALQRRGFDLDVIFSLIKQS